MTLKERRAVPAIEANVTTDDGVRLFAQVLGNGPSAVLVPNGFHLLDDFQYLATGRTLVFYDLRNRGRSDAVTDPAKLGRGIHHDVDDLDVVRRHFGFSTVSIIGHSYVGLTAILYAMKHSPHVERVVQVGALPPDPRKQYPAHLTGADATLRDVFGKIAELRANRASEDPEELCRKVWSVLSVIYVADPVDAHRIDWGRCELPNERTFVGYWTGHILPSIQSLELRADDLASIKAPVLVVHGTRDRSAPFGGGRDWARLLPNARLVTVEGAAHAPWIEAPETVFASIQAFLDGAWPEVARKVVD